MPTLTQDAIKVSVLSSGSILLEGKDVTLGELEQVFKAAKERKAPVLYYREAAAAEPPPAAMSVLQLIVANGLAISMCSRPDFSDWVDTQGVSHPRDAGANVEDAYFARARKHATSGRHVTIVRPDRQCMVLPAPPAGSMKPEATQSVESMLPSATRRNVAVIADTSFAAAPQPPQIAEVGRAIPFFGILIGLSYIGHAVWIFEGAAEALAAGCRDADVLIVDSAVLPRLPKEWAKPAGEAMRNPNILLFDRGQQKFLLARTAGTVKGKMEFPRTSI
jgi:hypothetical protein